MTNFLKKALLLIALAYVRVASAQSPSPGMEAMQLGMWDKAISIYSAQTKANPADQDAWLTLGNAYLAKGDKAKAAEAFQSAYNAKGEGALALVANGRQLLLQNKSSEADVQFAKAKKNAKKDMNAHRQIGESYIFFVPTGSQRPNLTRAIELLRTALDVNSRDVPTVMALAYAYKELPDGGQAALYYEQAAALDTKNPLPVFMQAKVYRLGKQPERFVDYSNRALTINPKYVPALRAQAEHYYFSKQWEKALVGYRRLVETGSPDLTIDDEMQLANSLFINKDYQGTIDLVEKIIKKDGSKNYLRRLLAYTYFEKGEYQKGLDILNEYFKMVTPDKVIPNDYTYLARLQMATKADTNVAIGNLIKAIDLETDSSKYERYKEIAELYRSRRDYCAAANAYKIFADSSGIAKALDFYSLGSMYFYCKEDSLRYQNAEMAFKRVTEMMPGAGVGWQWLGKSQARLDPDYNLFEKQPELIGQFGKARAAFEKYIELASVDTTKNKPGLIEAYAYLVYHDYLKSDRATFDKNVAKLLELDPENETGKGLKENFGTGGKPAPAPGGGKGKGKGKG